jgi:hypothetical protein
MAFILGTALLLACLQAVAADVGECLLQLLGWIDREATLSSCVRYCYGKYANHVCRSMWGNEAIVKIYNGAPHGFIGFAPGTIKAVQEGLDDIGAFVEAKIGA